MGLEETGNTEQRAGLGGPGFAFCAPALRSQRHPGPGLAGRGLPQPEAHLTHSTPTTKVFVFLKEIRDELRLITAPTFTSLRLCYSGSGHSNDFLSSNIMFLWLFSGQCHFGKISLLFSIF